MNNKEQIIIKVELGDNLYKLLDSMSSSGEICRALAAIFESVAKSKNIKKEIK